jgi:hypothetical protein
MAAEAAQRRGDETRGEESGEERREGREERTEDREIDSWRVAAGRGPQPTDGPARADFLPGRVGPGRGSCGHGPPGVAGDAELHGDLGAAEVVDPGDGEEGAEGEEDEPGAGAARGPAAAGLDGADGPVGEEEGLGGEELGGAGAREAGEGEGVEEARDEEDGEGGEERGAVEAVDEGAEDEAAAVVRDALVVAAAPELAHALAGVGVGAGKALGRLAGEGEDKDALDAEDEAERWVEHGHEDEHVKGRRKLDAEVMLKESDEYEDGDQDAAEFGERFR